MSGQVTIPVTTTLTVLLLSLEARHNRLDAVALRNVDTVAYHILKAQSDKRKPTVEELVQRVKDSIANDGEHVARFDRPAWTSLTEQVVVALKSDAPARALGRIRVNTAP